MNSTERAPERLPRVQAVSAAKAPWTSGMAQAVMAQALARAGRTDLARRAYRAIPGSLDRELAAGLHVASVPTVIAFRDGKELGRLVGLRPEGPDESGLSRPRELN